MAGRLGARSRFQYRIDDTYHRRSRESNSRARIARLGARSSGEVISMRAIPSLKISISGVRGVVGESLTPGLLVRFAQAFGTYTGPGALVIGRDTRTSGEMVRKAVVAGLLSSGCRVIDLDICPVPTVQLLVRERRARGGIAITASHNPAEWNALKFINSEGLFLAEAQARQLLDIYHQGEYVKVPGAEMRSV